MLAESLRTLAHLAAVRGRHAEAHELLKAADEVRRGLTPAEPSDHVRGVLQLIRDSGGDAVVAEELERIPGALAALLRTGACTSADAAALVNEGGVTSRREIEDAVEWTWPASLGQEIRGRVQAAAAESAPAPSVPLGRAAHLVERLLPEIAEACGGPARPAAAGGFRRFEPMVDDLTLVVASGTPDIALARLAGHGWSGPLLHAGPGRLVVRIDGIEVTLVVVHSAAEAPVLLWTTGSRDYVRALGREARERGLTLLPHGLARDGALLAVPSEAVLHEMLDLPDVPPELRNTAEIVPHVRRHGVPPLVTRSDIRGDLHMHTDWSDGRDTIDAMVAAAAALGYEFVAITDHSASAVIARGLDAGRLARQRDEVLRLREQYRSMWILHGSEVDILPDGSLDFPDRVLESLDVVLASLHDPAGQSGAALTDRYIRAMEHPLVHVITHPTNRLVPTRRGYALDEERLFEAAVRTRTIVEIDGAPGHLDMDGDMAARAIAAGVMVSIDSDCHRADLLGRQMDLGVGTARRGGVAAAHVINTRSLRDLQALLARKRSAI